MSATSAPMESAGPRAFTLTRGDGDDVFTRAEDLCLDGAVRRGGVRASLGRQTLEIRPSGNM